MLGALGAVLADDIHDRPALAPALDLRRGQPLGTQQIGAEHMALDAGDVQLGQQGGQRAPGGHLMPREHREYGTSLGVAHAGRRILAAARHNEAAIVIRPSWHARAALLILMMAYNWLEAYTWGS